MDEALEMLLYIVGTAVTGALGTWGALALSAIRRYMKAKASQQFIDMLERTIVGGARLADAKGYDRQAAEWLRSVLTYTERSIPEAIAREKASTGQLERKIETMKPVLDDLLNKALQSAINKGFR